MKIKLLSFFLSFTILLVGQDKDISSSINDFGNSLFDLINHPGENTVISPYSLCSSLYMTYVGAREDTERVMKQSLFLTLGKKQLSKAYLKLNASLTQQTEEEKGISLHIANKMWIDEKAAVLKNYDHLLKRFFQSSVEEVNFKKSEEAIKKINLWVSENTNRQIPYLLQGGDVDPQTEILLTNAIYFKGSWTHPFKEMNSYKGQFYPLKENASPQRIDMMHQMANFPYSEDESFQYLLLPFYTEKTRSDIALLILLPKENTKQTPFSIFYQKIQETPFGELCDKFKEELIDLHLPKFTCQSRYELSNALRMMGMENPFSSEADFSGISGKKDLHLSKVFHQALFSINEFGALATASTAVSIGLTAVPSEKKPISFFADKPFLFILFDKTQKTVLFLGELDTLQN